MYELKFRKGFFAVLRGAKFAQCTSAWSLLQSPARIPGGRTQDRTKYIAKQMKRRSSKQNISKTFPGQHINNGIYTFTCSY